jgi:hypothetical protein
MGRGPRKYPARQEFLDAAIAAGFTSDVVNKGEQTLYSYSRSGSYNSATIECDHIQIYNVCTAWFRKDTGAFVKGENFHGSKTTKAGLLRCLQDRNPAAMKVKQAEEQQRVEETRARKIEEVADNYAHKVELEKLAMEYAFKVAMETGVPRDVAVDIVLGLIDAGALAKLDTARKDRERAGQGYTTGSYKTGEWENGRLVSW